MHHLSKTLSLVAVFDPFRVFSPRCPEHCESSMSVLCTVSEQQRGRRSSDTPPDSPPRHALKKAKSLHYLEVGKKGLKINNLI